jgi:hypothetical protein
MICKPSWLATAIIPQVGPVLNCSRAQELVEDTRVHCGISRQVIKVCGALKKHK